MGTASGDAGEGSKMTVLAGSVSKKTIRVHSAPLKKQPERFPWPRTAEDDPLIQLGIDVIAKKQDIIKLVSKFRKVKDYPMEDLMQEVFTAIIHKNRTRSAHDPRKSSLGHYVFMISDHVCINIVNKKKRYDRESESFDAPGWSDDQRSLLDVFEDESQNQTTEDEFRDGMRDVAESFRAAGLFEEARYITAARTGASNDILRQILSFGNKKVSNKDLRDLRARVESALRNGIESKPLFISINPPEFNRMKPDYGSAFF